MPRVNHSRIVTERLSITNEHLIELDKQYPIRYEFSSSDYLEIWLRNFLLWLFLFTISTCQTADPSMQKSLNLFLTEKVYYLEFVSILLFCQQHNIRIPKEFSSTRQTPQSR